MCDSGDFAAAAQAYRMASINQNFILERSADGFGTTDSGTIVVNAGEYGIELADYKLDISGLHCSSRETVEEYYSRDSLSLVKFWGADTDYSGGAYRIDRLYDSADRKIQIKNNRKGQRIAVIGYNVFGGRFSAEIHI